MNDYSKKAKEYFDIAVKCFKKNEFAEAANMFALSSIESKGEYLAKTLYNIGVCMYRTNKEELALAYYKASLTIHPLDDVYFNIAVSAYDKGMNKIAEKYIDIAFRINPKDEDVLKLYYLVHDKCNSETQDDTVDVEQNAEKYVDSSDLPILLAEINLSLDTGNKDMFNKVSKIYNDKLKGMNKND